MHCSFYTGMTVLQKNWVAAPTLVTVEEILASSRSADPTAITMVLFLRCIIIKQLASLAEVFSHAYTTADAELLNLLLCATKGAYHFSDLMAGHFMSQLLIHIDTILRIIMAMPAVKNFIATRSSYATPSTIMWTSIFHQPFIENFWGIFHIHWLFTKYELSTTLLRVRASGQHFILSTGCLLEAFIPILIRHEALNLDFRHWMTVLLCQIARSCNNLWAPAHRKWYKRCFQTVKGIFSDPINQGKHRTRLLLSCMQRQINWKQQQHIPSNAEQLQSPDSNTWENSHQNKYKNPNEQI